MQGEQGLAHELIERHHYRNWIAGQAKEMRPTDFAIGERAAGLHGDFPEHHFAELLHELLDEIRLTHRNAATGNDHIGIGCRVLECLFEQRQLVAHHAHVHHLATQAHQHAVQRVAVGVINLPRT